jgi:mono/diheme cytochrome c family protein
MKRLMIWSIALMASLLLSSQMQAQQTREQARRGHHLARTGCAGCHGVERGARRSPVAAAPLFTHIANTRGMTATQISAAMQTAAHRRMPSFRLNRDQLIDITFYILSLKQTAQ